MSGVIPDGLGYRNGKHNTSVKQHCHLDQVAIGMCRFDLYKACSNAILLQPQFYDEWISRCNGGCMIGFWILLTPVQYVVSVRRAGGGVRPSWTGQKLRAYPVGAMSQPIYAWPCMVSGIFHDLSTHGLLFALGGRLRPPSEHSSFQFGCSEPPRGLGSCTVDPLGRR